ncbi:MAG: riboflavin synthase, partial [Planctomycetes bacterium]|nr:riboflavin synthase [Planctomycetota bacterium]
MFTGIIEAVGTVRAKRSGKGAGVISVELGGLADGSGIGDSIAINGICLTISRLVGSLADFDVSDETTAKSTLGRIVVGDHVNLERAMPATGRFGGHIVQGHIDGTATVKSIDRSGEFAGISFSANPDLLDAIVPKGSVAVNGVSLTVAKVDKGGFSIAVIPTTLKETTLAALKVGQAVNIETDI